MSQELRTVIWIIVVGSLLILGFRYLFPVFAPFCIGLLLACWVDPLVTSCEARFKIQRGFIIGTILSGFTLVILAVVVLTVFALYQEAVQFLPKIPAFVNQLNLSIIAWIQDLVRFFKLNQIEFQIFSPIPESFNHIFRSFLIWVMQLLPGLPQIFMAVALGGITAYFLSRDKKKISRGFYRIFPSKWSPVLAELKHDLLDTIAKYLRAELSLAVITGVLTALGLKIIGIPGAFIYGILAGLLDFIPVLGPGLIFFPLAFINLLFGRYPYVTFFLLLYVLILLTRQLLEIRLVGDNLHVHPLLALLIMYIGMKFYGFAGIFYGPLILIILRSVYRALTVHSKLINTDKPGNIYRLRI